MNNLNTARREMGGTGSSTAGLVFGGGPPEVAITESWNGTNWTEVADLGTARWGSSGAGTTTAGLAFGGNASGTITNATEEWNDGPQVKTITTD